MAIALILLMAFLAALGRHTAIAFCTRRSSLVPPIVRAPLFSTSTTTNSVEEEYDWETLLPFEKHAHNSVKITVPPVDVDVSPSKTNTDLYDALNFHSKLEATLTTAQQLLNKSAIWLSVPISRAALIEEASKSGFTFHHAEGNSATLSKWLLDEEESRIPTYATHQVGVGAMVINSSTNQILCVRETRNNYRPWKIPGGLAELGEQLDEAAIREVYEETGIRCTFQHVLGLRHTHGAQFGRSDLYFVCQLQPIQNFDGTLPKPTPQAGEIEAVSWLPLDEYRDMVFDNDVKVGHPMMKRFMEVVDEKNAMQRMVVPSIVPGRNLSPLYHAPIKGIDSD